MTARWSDPHRLPVPPTGYVRAVNSADPPHVLQVDPDTIGHAVALFERYALGNVSAKDLAEESGLAESRIRMILMNPIYNGWIRRYRRTRNETRAGACRWPPRGRSLPRAVARVPGCQREPRAHERRWDLAGACRGVAPGVVSDVEGG
jgi:hypothetical protein